MVKQIIPKVLFDHAVKLGHDGQQGVVKTKSYMRSKVWFPNMNAEGEAAIPNFAKPIPENRDSANPREMSVL